MRRKVKSFAALLLICSLVCNQAFVSMANISEGAAAFGALPVPATASEAEEYAEISLSGISSDSGETFTEVYIDDGNIQIEDGRIVIEKEDGSREEMAFPADGALKVRQRSEQHLGGKGIKVLTSNAVRLYIENIKFEGESLLDLSPGSEVTLSLLGNSRLISKGKDKAMIHVPQSSMLTIDGEGSLDIQHISQLGAAIGGADREKNGKICITGGVISGKNNGASAFIGGGSGATYGPIEISGGEIKLELAGVLSGSLIGCGYFAGKDAESIKISGGKIAVSGGWGSALIGSCYMGGEAYTGNILIEGGELNIGQGYQTHGLRAERIEIKGGYANLRSGDSGKVLTAKEVLITGGDIILSSYHMCIEAVKSIVIEGGNIEMLGAYSLFTVFEGLFCAPKVEIKDGNIYAEVASGKAIITQDLAISGGNLQCIVKSSSIPVHGFDDQKPLERFVISGGSVRIDKKEGVLTLAAKTGNGNKTEEFIQATDENAEPVYLKVFEGVSSEEREKFYVDGKLYRPGNIFKGDDKLYIYQSRGYHSIQQGNKIQSVFFGEELDNGSIRFMVSDSMDLSAIEEVSVEIYQNEKLLYSGKADRISLPAGEYSAIFRKQGYYGREQKFTIEQNQEKELQIYLNSSEVVKVSVQAKQMSKEEIMQAGIDPTAEENKQLFKFAVVLEFAAAHEPVSFQYIGHEGGRAYGGQMVLLEGVGGMPVGSYVKIQPISERFYLIIHGHSEWLKEMYDVELLVHNQSKVESLENVVASLNALPQGLSFSLMQEREQSLVQDMGSIGAGQVKSVHWYINGDKEGEYVLSGKVSGDMGFGGQSFENLFVTGEPLKVLAGKALHLYISLQEKVKQGGLYHILFELKNEGKHPVYNLSLQLDREEQYRVSKKGKTGLIYEFKDEDIQNQKVSVEELLPGESLCLAYETVIEFESELYKNPEYVLLNRWLRMLAGSTTEIPHTFKKLEGEGFGAYLSLKEFPTLEVCHSEDPVDLLSGQFIWEYTDIRLHGRKNLDFHRTYRTVLQQHTSSDASPEPLHSGSDARQKLFGTGGWSTQHDYSLDIGNKRLFLYMPEEEFASFVEKEGIYVSEAGSSWYVEKKDGMYILDTGRGRKLCFDEEGRLSKITEEGEETFYEYTGERLTKISNISGSFVLSYNAKGLPELLTDSAGRKVGYAYDEKGRLIKVTVPDGASFTYRYDEADRLTDVEDLNGNDYITNAYDEQNRVIYQNISAMGEFSYSYDTENRINSYTRQDGSRVSISYDEKKRIVSMEDEAGKEKYTYNDKNQKTEFTDKKGNVTKYEYDDKSNITAVVYPDGSRECFAYNAEGRIIGLEDREGHNTKIEYGAAGKPVKITNALGQSSSFVYDDSGNLIKEEHPDKHQIIYTYDDKGNVLSAQRSGKNVQYFLYDEAGRMIQKKNAYGKTDFQYSPGGKLLSKTDPVGSISTYQYSPNGYVLEECINGVVQARYSYNEMNKLTRQEDALGNVLYYHYDSVGNLERIDNEALGHSITYRYDSLGRVIEKTNPRGYKTSYGYDALNNPIYVKDALGNSSYMEYDALSRLIKETNALGHTKEYEYDKNGRLTAMRNALGNASYIHYDALGRIISIQDVEGRSEEYSYNESGKVASVRDKTGAVTSYMYEASGALASVTDPRGNITEFSNDFEGRPILERNAIAERKKEYDALGRLIREGLFGGASQSYTYDAFGNLISVQDASGAITKYTYDALGQIKSIEDALGNKSFFSYDGAGQIIKLTYPDESTEEFSYDGNGNLIQHKDGRGNVRTYEYDALDRRIKESSPLGYQKRYRYDAAGQLTHIETSDGFTEHFTYDVCGNIECYEDGSGITARYRYDGCSNPIALILYNDLKEDEPIPRELFYQFSYDENGRCIREEGPLGRRVSYTYDKAGNLTEKTDGDLKTEYEYDALNRLVKAKYGDGKQVQYEYNADGYLTAYEDQYGRTSFTLDALGRIKAADMPYWSGLRYEYDKIGNLTKIDVGDGVGIAYTYDSMSRIKNVRHTQTGSSFSYDYDKAGNIVKKILADGTIEKRSYDAENRLTEVFRNDSLQADYQYTSNGSVSMTREAFGGVRVLHEYFYDRNQRLESENILFDYYTEEYPFMEEDRYGYSYDMLGNLKGESFRQEPTDKRPLVEARKKYSYDEGNRLTEKIEEKEGVQRIHQYGYDERGNLTSETVWDEERNYISGSSYHMDARGRLQRGGSGEGVDYQFDGMGRMIKRGDEIIIPHYAYEVDVPIRVFGKEGKLTHFYGTEGEIGVYANGQTYSYELDRQASIRAVRNQEGTVVSTFVYDAWGRVLRENVKEGFESSIVSVPSYAGHRYDEYLGQYYAKARLYSAESRRFSQIDPIKDGFNWYQYCRNNPVRYVDPDGEKISEKISYKEEYLKEINVKKEYKRDRQEMYSVPRGEYIGAVYLGSTTELEKLGHTALLLVREDRTGDLFSYVGENSLSSLIESQAHVEYFYGVSLEVDVANWGEEFKEEDEDDMPKNKIRTVGGGGARLPTILRSGESSRIEYMRGIYFSISHEEGLSISAAARETKIYSNLYGENKEGKGYNLLVNNCETNVRNWLEAGGVHMHHYNHIIPNDIYESAVSDFQATREYRNKGEGYQGIYYGTLQNLWHVIAP